VRVVVTLVRSRGDWARDYVIEADPATPLRDIVEAMCDQAGPVVLDPDAFHLGDRPLDLTRTLGAGGIRDGSVLSVDGPAGGARERRGLVTVRVVAGPGAGSVTRLGAGEFTLGADPAGDPATAVAACTVALDATVQVRALPGAGADLDRQPLTAEPAQWPPGAQLRIGPSLLEAHPERAPDAVIDPAPDGEWLNYNRPPRILAPERRTSFTVPAEPRPTESSPLPWVAAGLPAMFGVLMATLFHNPLYLLVAGMSPVVMLANGLTGRRQGRKSFRRRLAEHRAHLAAVEADIAAALAVEKTDRRQASPDAAELLITATDPRSRLWERRRTDPDHLLVRVGTADLCSRVRVEDRGELEHRRAGDRVAPDVPVAFSVAAAGVVGVAGPGDWPRLVARWLVGQLAVLQSPRDLQVYLLTDSDGERCWDFASWLPHLRPALGQDALVLAGVDAETLGRRVAELTELVGARRRSRLDARSGTLFADPDILVVLDGARRLRALPGVVTLLQDGPAVGVYCLCVDSDERTLPEECAAVVLGGPGRDAVLRRQRSPDVTGIRADDVDPGWYDRVGRALSPLRDVSETQGDSALPAAARLLDVLALPDPDAASIVSRWALSGRSTTAVVGVSLDGPFGLDLVAHGPHGLVAGTTGAGKSEFLQTLVASLAVANRPDAMTFVLVDYKGGAAFKDCAHLPHTVGMVTDLDSHLVERALTSLGAELTYREHQLAAAGAKDLEDYLDYAARRGDLAPIPRLLIVIDEFASMARELPDFVSGLVNVAQRGRSLGIHLVLATQRPSGAVSPEIRANTNLRVALRVTGPGESSEVIDAPDAATISAATPGRAYARLGHSSLLPFQSGRVGGRRPAGTAGTRVREPVLRRLRWADVGRPAPTAPAPAGDTDVATDLSVLVAAIRAAGERLGVPAQRRPWLPPLPQNHVVTPARPGGAVDIAPFEWALQDLPAEQRQAPARIDLASFGHLYVVGAPRSGRSQALRTVAASAASAASCADLHVYGLDCGNGALLPLAKLPHAGAIVQRTETERAVRLLSRLHEEVLRRQELLGQGGFADVTEQRRAAAGHERLPHLLLLLDRWEGFVGTLGEHDAGALTEKVHTLLREGASVGLHLVVAGDHSLLSGRMAALCDDKILLRLTDRTDFSLAGLNYRKLPETIPPGRGYRAGGGVETQVALLADDPSGPAQVAALTALAGRLGERERDVPRAQRPFRVAVLPKNLLLDQAWAFLPAAGERPMWAMIGVGGDDLVAVGADLGRDRPTFLVAGPSRSGRSTALCVLAESLLRNGTELVVAAPAPSPLRDLAGRPGVRAVVTGDAPTAEVLAPLLDPDGTDVVLVVDDGEVLRDAPAGDYLRAYVRGAAANRRGLILGGNAAEVGGGFTGWQVDVKKNRRGALLCPQNLTDGDLVGVRVPRSSLSSHVTPGRAHVHLGGGELVTVQVPGIGAS
jgi:DNA segregation ATPase FtsK/SpoIIIE, S-DNA-T family